LLNREATSEKPFKNNLPGILCSHISMEVEGDETGDVVDDEFPVTLLLLLLLGEEETWP
jgi:hypothetical protein